MQTGKINVQTENIFPIIKKFLYSDHEIFLRELVSNAVDATQKLKTFARLAEFNGELGDITIEIVLNKDAKTITIKDKGVGMTAAEVEKYINQIAFSGAEEFLTQYKDKIDGNNIIGHFGLGFYSAFMVAKKVEIITKSFRNGEDSGAVHWSCDGSPEYTLVPHNRQDRGTDIILHIADDSEEFLEDNRIKSILEKYCKFLPVAIKYGTKDEWIDDPEGKKDKDGNIERVKTTVDNIINNPNPAWVRKPQDLTDEDYKNFYRELYPFAEDPLFHIHLNVDYPFNLTGILYFPKLKNNFEMQKNKIQLYSNQVFVTDSVEGIVPDFLMLLHGVIDSPDIPLNVSRSYLQSDGNVKKISSHITKKVADKLDEMFRNDRADFEKKWDDIKLFIEFGMLTDEKFFEKALKFDLLKTTSDQYFTFEEYKEKFEKIHTDKNEKFVILYCADVKEQHAYIESANEKGYTVVSLNSPLTAHYIQKLEGKYEKTSFVRVDSDVIDNLIKKEENTLSKLSDTEKEALKPIIEEKINDKSFSVQFENLSETDAPMMITRPEFMRRMKEMNQVGGGGMMWAGNMPDMYNLIVNSNHPIITKINAESDTEAKASLIKQTFDLALLSQGMLKGEALTQFIKRSVSFIQ
jgi:molecular chaperone HtpG